MQPARAITDPVVFGDRSWNICVMTRGETYFATSEGAIRGFEVTAPGAFHDTGRLLADVGEAFGERPEGLLLIPVLPGNTEEEYDESTSPAGRWATMEASALRAGWRATGEEGKIRDTGWVSFRHLTSDRVIHMGILTLMDQSRTPLFDLAADAETIVKHLISYASVTGVVWRMTAGVSGCSSIRDYMAERAQRQLTLPELAEDPDAGQPHWRWDTASPELHGAGHMIWARTLSPAEKAGEDPRVVTYDVRAQFLAAMAGYRFGWGKPVQRKAVPFDPERAGFWHIAASGPLSLGGPPIVRQVDSRGLTWVTTPVMVYLREKGIEPMVYDSWTTATSSEWLKGWAQRIRDALYAESQYLREIETALKRTYSETNGMFNVAGGSIFRRDLHWTTVDGATMNVRRKIDRVHQVLGIWPCEVYHDAVSYPVLDPHGFNELNAILGVQYPQQKRISIGHFKYVGHCTISEWETKQWNKKERRSGRA